MKSSPCCRQGQLWQVWVRVGKDCWAVGIRMKRVIAFLIIFVVISSLAFWVSLVLYPEWLKVASGPAILFRNILAIGLGIIATGAASWFISFLFDDKDFKERLEYFIGNKYGRIFLKLDKVTKAQISKEKRSRKYIPNVFVETTDIKEKLRYFCEPYLFFPKIVDQAIRRIQSAYIIDALKKVHYPVENEKVPDLSRPPRNRKELREKITLLKDFLTRQGKVTDILSKDGGRPGIKPEFRSKIPSEYSHVHDYISPNLRFLWTLEDTITHTREDIDLLTNKVLIIKAIAGHGKTNLLCDFTENFLLKKKHKCIYLGTGELNHLGEQETVEQALMRALFADEYQFIDILRLIKFDKKIDDFFIVFDGINEHKNLALFASALEQFIQRMSEHNIKIILTCRSEYFDDRFGNLLRLDNLSIIDLDDWRFKHEIPDVHIKALIANYFSEFNIQLDPRRVGEKVSQTFNDDKLLLRIFCEAYENENPTDYLHNIYKLEIFNKYLEKKSAVIKGLTNCLSEIITWMIEHDEFSNIRFENLSKETIDVIDATAHENVVIKRDLITVPEIAFGKADVINFVYDEFRDYLIASRILLLWGQDITQSKYEVEKLTKTFSTTSEGIQKYLCLYSIKNDNTDLLDYLSTFEWFSLVFVDSVFDTPDKYVSDYSIGMVQAIFCSTSRITLRIVWELSHRINNKRFSKLNIELLFSWIIELNEDKYLGIFSDALTELARSSSYLAYICYLIVNATRDNDVPTEAKLKLIQFLGYLTAIREKIFLRYSEYDFGTFPAFDALLRIGESTDRIIVLDGLTRAYETMPIEPVRQKIKDLIDSLGEN